MTASDSRPSARARGYTWRWEKARATYLRSKPLCVMCNRDRRVTLASVVDHIIPHKGDQTLFWDTSNWQGLCKTHHDSTKHMQEHGRVVGCDANGIPTDPAHPWNTGR